MSAAIEETPPGTAMPSLIGIAQLSPGQTCHEGAMTCSNANNTTANLTR